MSKRHRSTSQTETKKPRSQPTLVKIEIPTRVPQSSSDEDDSEDNGEDCSYSKQCCQGQGHCAAGDLPNTSRKRRHRSRSRSRSASEKSDNDEKDDNREKKKSSSSKTTPISPPLDVVKPTVKPDRPVVLVIDTNILLEADGLDFLEKVMRNEWEDVFPNLQILVPHIVFLELDKQKSSRQRELAFRARTASRFLEGHMCVDGVAVETKKKPRVIGQTLDEFTEAAKKHAAAIADDHFLFCCLHFQEEQRGVEGTLNSALVVPLTNDRILRTRCSINHLKCHSLGSLLEQMGRKREKRPSSLFDPPEVDEENKENDGD